jgi:hypothetical protein
MSFVRRWSPVLLAVAASLFVQKVLFEPRYDIAGHAAGHLQSASAPFGGFVLVAALLYTTPRARRQPLVLVACALWLTATVLVLVGNVRVVDALLHAGLGRTPTDLLPANAAVDAAHGLANSAPWLGVAAALALCAAAAFHRLVSRGVAVGAAVLSVIVPAWIFPGAGVIVLVVARCVAFERGFGHRKSGEGMMVPASS